MKNKIRGKRITISPVDDACTMSKDDIREALLNSAMKQFSTGEKDELNLKLRELGILSETDNPKTLSQEVEEVINRFKE